VPSISNIRTDGGGTLGSAVQQQWAAVATPPRPPGRHAYHARDSWVISCDSWMQQRKVINLWCNPSSAQWSVGRRGTSVKTAAGTSRNVWRNHYRGTYYDEAEVALTFQSGNIMPVMGYEGRGQPAAGESVVNWLRKGSVPPGLQNFYDFMALLNEPQTLGPAENHHTITYHSRVFPRLTMWGFFQDDQRITWSERADDTGNSIEWNATFVVYGSNPRIDSRYAAQLTSTYLTWITSGGGAGEALPLGMAASASAEQYLSTAVSPGSPGPKPPGQGTLQTGGGKTTSGGKPPPAPAAPGVQLPAGSGAAAASQVSSSTVLMLGGGLP
jgi:hypothetical protein